MADKPITPAALYFDSNILRKAGWPDPAARLLEIVDKATNVGVAPAMVDLVRRELTEGWVRDLVRDRRSLADKAREYARRTQGLSEAVDPPRLPPAADLRAHIAKVTEKFTARFRPVPTSQQPTEYFMSLALSRGGAFVEGGKGFNDTVILASIIEDMTARGLEAAVFVSEDRAFQGEGVKQVTAGKHLRIVTSIEEVDDILDEMISERVHAYLKEKKETLLAAVKARQGELSKFLRQHLPSITGDLAMVDKVRKIELLDILAYEDAHSVPFALGQENREENRLSVDVKLRVRLETETFLFERRRERLDASPYVIHPEDLMISSSDQEIVVTVEGAAEVTDEGIQALRFTGLRAKTSERGLGLASLFREANR